MSILAVTAPAARRGLTAIATVKREFGITGSADHEFLEDLIRQASAAGLQRRILRPQRRYQRDRVFRRQHTRRFATHPILESEPAFAVE
jgi:hypothetical protein